MNIQNLVSDILQTFGDAVPGIKDAIQYRERKERLALDQREQEAKESYMEFLINRMSPSGAENYFKNQNPHSNFQSQIVSLIPHAINEETKSSGQGRKILSEFINTLDLNPVEDVLFTPLVWSAFNNTISRLSQNSSIPQNSQNFQKSYIENDSYYKQPTPTGGMPPQI